MVRGYIKTKIMEKRYIGIDPGVNGGIAVLSADGTVVEVVKMPGTARDLLDFLRRYKDDSVCVLDLPACFHVVYRRHAGQRRSCDV